MEKTLNLINQNLNGKYMTIIDKAGHMLEGIYDHSEWVIPSDIYTGGNMQLKCFVKLKYEKDKEQFNVDDSTGLASCVFEVPTIEFVLLDDNGNIIDNHRLMSSPM